MRRMTKTTLPWAHISAFCCAMQDARSQPRGNMTVQIPQPQFSSRLGSPVGQPQSLSPISMGVADLHRKGSSGHSSPTPGADALRRSINTGRSKIPKPAKSSKGEDLLISCWILSLAEHVLVHIPMAYSIQMP